MPKIDYVICERPLSLYKDLNGLCVMQFVRLATTCVTSQAALHASLDQRLYIKLD